MSKFIPFGLILHIWWTIESNEDILKLHPNLNRFRQNVKCQGYILCVISLLWSEVYGCGGQIGRNTYMGTKSKS